MRWHGFELEIETELEIVSRIWAIVIVVYSDSTRNRTLCLQMNNDINMQSLKSLGYCWMICGER